MMRTSWHTLALCAALAAPLAAQHPGRDSGRLVVRRADSIVGEEEFSLEVVPDGDGSRTFNLVVAASYPPGGPTRRVVATFTPRRITVRVSSEGAESAREYPRGGRALVMHQELLGMLAVAGHLSTGPIAVYPFPSPRQLAGSLDDEGQERLRGPGTPPLRHLVVRGGPADVHVWVDAEGRLVRVAVPAQGIVADRVAAR